MNGKLLGWLVESVAVLRLTVVFRKAYNTGILHDWYRLIDILFVMSHVEFKSEISILILKNWATCHNWNRKVFKIVDCAQWPPHCVSHSAILKLLCALHAIGQDQCIPEA
jgi:hypothetical protein